MTVNFESETGDCPDFDYKKDLADVVEAVCRQEKCPFSPEVNITFTDNENIRKLNREFRNIDRATDVLSFPEVDFRKPADFSILDDPVCRAGALDPETGDIMFGDIVISVERAEAQAEEYGHSLRREVCFLTAHSMLHLFGYDHMEEEERKVMEERQNMALNSLGITRDS